MRSPCRLAALGMIDALGADTDAIGPRLAAGDQSRFVRRGHFVADRELLLGEVLDPLPEIPDALARFDCRNNALALAVLEAIRPDVDAALARHGAERIGVVAGTSTSGVVDAENAIREKLDTDALAPHFAYAQLEFGGLAAFWAEASGARGPAFTLSTACSSGARALATARSLLALGLCDAVLAGASDSLCGLTTGGFTALQALAPDVANPFSLNRCGLTLGEGAALFLVTREPGGVQLLGVGESSEAHHMSAPDPEGRGAEKAMRHALDDAGLGPDAVAYLNLHGTGTPLNDAMESWATHRVLGPATPCCSTKALFGHTLGAAGALEAGVCWWMLDQSADGSLVIPPHRWDGVRDPELAEIHLATAGEKTPATDHAVVMTNSFGFGGNNCTLVLGRSFEG